MSIERFVFVFKPSNRGISIPRSQAKVLIENKDIIVDKSKKVYKNHDCFFIYANDPDFNLLRYKYNILC